MKVIWKVPLRIQQKISMPQGATIVHDAFQGAADNLTAWFLCDPEATPVERTFQLVGTGHAFPDNHRHIHTFQVPPFVWHILEVM